MVQPVIALFSHKRKNRNSAREGLISTMVNRAKSFGKMLVSSFKWANQRHALSQLNDHQLRDIGLTRDQVGGNANRGFFDAQSQRYYDLGVRQPQSSIAPRPPIRKLHD